METEAKVETSNGAAPPAVVPPAATPRGLMMKLAEVMACVDRVAKNGVNATQGYNYAMAADIYDAVRSELARRFVLMVPRMEKCDFTDLPTKAGGTQKLCTVYVRFEFTDCETGEVLPITSIGQGTDSGDKAAYKAMTGATKQCLIQTFLIPTGEDPENEKPERGGPPAPAGTQALKSKVGKSGHDRTFTFAFGNNKGQPISALTVEDLQWYEKAVQNDLKDASKSKYHARAAQQLAIVQAELKFRTEAPDLDAEARPGPRLVPDADKFAALVEALKAANIDFDGEALVKDPKYQSEMRQLALAARKKAAEKKAEPEKLPSQEAEEKKAAVGPVMLFGTKKNQPIASLSGPDLLESIALGESKVGQLKDDERSTAEQKAVKVRACIDALKAEQKKREAELLRDPGEDLDVD